MIAKRYLYSTVCADLVTLQDGELLQGMIDQSAYAKLYGVFVYTGHSEIVSSNANNVGMYWESTGRFQPNTIEVPCDVRATGETTWLCVSQNDEIRREVQEQIVNGSYILPATWGFLVLDGSVQVEGKTANQFQFFRARDIDVEVQGTSVLLLVK
jgi:hypothetical protein